MSNPVDCLVLKIDEVESDTKLKDTTLFIIYDKNTHEFIIRGKRQDTKKITGIPYSFVCEYADDLVEFISFVIDCNNKISYTLYNYDNLPATSNELTFKFFEKHVDIEYELTGYDNQKYNKKELVSILRMLRNVYNKY